MNQGTFSDYHWQDGYLGVLTGGHWPYSRERGIFTEWSSDMYSEYRLSSRLSKNQVLQTISDYHDYNGYYLTIVGGTYEYTNTIMGMFINLNTTDGRAWYNICSRIPQLYTLTTVLSL